jgi:hypothetical protein
MNLKLIVAVTLFAVAPTISYAQKNAPPAPAPKPSMADVQKLVQTISADPAKLKAYCDMGKVQEQMEPAMKKNDKKTIDALGAKIDALSQQIGPDYIKVMDGLDSVDPSSAEGKKFGALFDPLIKQCK